MRLYRPHRPGNILFFLMFFSSTLCHYMMLLRSPSLSILLSPSVDIGLQQGITSLRVQYGPFKVHRDRESKKTTGDLVCKNKQYLKTELEQQQKNHWK